jgi:methylmalonyl-CoA mutase N-terminal domain/subunit
MLQIYLNIPAKKNCLNLVLFLFQLPHAEAGATADIELAYTLADGLECIRTGLSTGIEN